MECVNIVDIFLAFIDFPFDPVAIEIFEKMIDILGGRRISGPLADIKPK